MIYYVFFWVLFRIKAMKYIMLLLSGLVLAGCGEVVVQETIPAMPPVVEKPIITDDIMCAMQYDPVCVEIEVQCITTPCPPIKQTASNACEAGKLNGVILHEGVCEDDLKPTFDAAYFE